MCQGVGWITRQLPPGHRDFGQPEECPCGRIQRGRLALLDGTFGFSDELRGCRLDSLRYFASHEQGVSAARAYAAEPHGWLYLAGPHGDGKTRLLAAIINELRAAGQGAIFAVAAEILDYLRKQFGEKEPGAFDSAFERLKAAPVLGVDDLPRAAGTAWADERLYVLFGWRYRHGLPTIVTSNHAPAEIEDKRLASRFQDVRLGRVVHCGDHDIRRYGR